MKKSIIIPYHSNLNALKACYYSLEKTIDFDTDITIVHNNSNPDAAKLDRSFFKCRIIEIHENLFYPAAVNLGVNESKGDILIFCDADTYYFNKDWEYELLKPLQRGDVGFSGAKLLSPYNRRIIDFGIAATAYNFPHPFKNRESDFALTIEDWESFGACAACSAIRREDFKEAGLYDETLVQSYSDIDLSIRLRQIGLSTISTAGALVYHKGSSTTGSGMSENLKEDCKGVFCAKNRNFIESNMEKFIEITSQHFIKSTQIAKTYICVNLSTVADAKKYINLYGEYLNVELLYIYNFPYKQRDAFHIDLYHTLDYNIRAMKLPIIYFADDFLSIKNNSLWYDYRDCDDDIVIDRNFNIEKVL